jgi:asparaginyl-tRNA synthetase
VVHWRHQAALLARATDIFWLSTLDLANLPRTPGGKVDFAQDFFGREAFLTFLGQLNAAPAEALLKYTFAALLGERQEDLAFFDERIEKGLVAKLEGIVGSEFVHMDYGEAIQVLERAKEKFEFRSSGASTCSRSTSAI